MINFKSACEVQVHRTACQLNRSPCFLFSVKYPGLQCGLGAPVETGSYIGVTVENVTLELCWSYNAMHWSHTVDFGKSISTESRQYLALGRAVWMQYSNISILYPRYPLNTVLRNNAILLDAGKFQTLLDANYVIHIGI